jgi:hypothetical protein
MWESATVLHVDRAGVLRLPALGARALDRGIEQIRTRPFTNLETNLPRYSFP